MSKIKLRERKFPTKLCRMLCARFYGKNPTNSVWADWRGAIGVVKRSKWLTGDQLLRLCAIAHLRQDIPRRPLWLSEIQGAEAAVSPVLIELIELLDRERIAGADAAQFLRDIRGSAPHVSTLYRKIPNFSASEYYPPYYLLKVA